MSKKDLNEAFKSYKLFTPFIKEIACQIQLLQKNLRTAQK
jgi:hypothetical protein